MADFPIPRGLDKLRAAFQVRGYDLRFVGGAVRDHLVGLPIKDFDLCTDATPEEQGEIYRKDGFRHYGTGLHHGTWTVVIRGQSFEITSLRIDREHDGRRATVEFTQDWDLDLARRDLTINAMARTFEGELIDPFGGEADLRANIVRFVGDAGDRIREDYLRILRWVRFCGRYGEGAPQSDETVAAIRENATGLRHISGERIWQEMKQIAALPRAGEMLRLIQRLRLVGHIRGRVAAAEDFERLDATLPRTSDPMARLVALLGPGKGGLEGIDQLSRKWRWSRAEKALALYLHAHLGEQTTFHEVQLRVVCDAHEKAHAASAALMNGQSGLSKEIAAWQVPTFPLSGADLRRRGMAPGPAMGEALARLRRLWAESHFQEMAETLLKKL